MKQIKQLTLQQNFSWTFVGNVVYAASQWGMVVVLAKLGSPEKVGQFTLGLAVTAPVFMLTNLQLRAIQATDARNEYLFSDYLGVRLIATTLALLIVAGITITSYGYRWEISMIILVIALAKAFESISDVFYGLIQQHERMDLIAIALMIKGPMSLLFLGIGVYLTGSVLGGALGLAVAWAFVLFTWDIRNGRLILKSSQREEGERLESMQFPSIYPEGDLSSLGHSGSVENKLHPSWDLRTLGKLIWLALPLGFVMMLISLNINIPRYFIEHYLGEHDLGIFSALSYLMVAGNIVVSALGSSASPRLAKYYAAGNSEAFRTLLLKLVGIAIGLGGGVIMMAVVAGREILTLLYSPEYAQQVDLFVLLMVAAGLGYVASFLGYGITAARYFRIQMPLFALITGISAIACFWLVPALGLQGAAIALIIGAIVQTAFSLAVITHALLKLNRYGTTEEATSIN